MKASLTLFLFLPVYFTPLIAYPAPETGADSLHLQACSALATGDSTRALGLLDMALELDPKHGEAYLARGRLFLAAGDPDAARQDFNNALFSKSPDIRALAHIGLGDILRQMPKRNLEAIKEYRLALQIAPANLEALFAISRAGMGMSVPKGFRIASEALIRLLCLDPCFHDAYALWRDTILDKTYDELLIVSNTVEKYVSKNPDKSTWLFDLAGFRYQIEEIDKALENLSRLERACPEYRVIERLLLRARCFLELDEITGFERSYFEAVKAAQRTGDFTRLVAETEPIFEPAENRKADECKSAEDWAVFFRKFWKRRDPDPLTPENERLVEHYRRLRKAEKVYAVSNPYPNRFKTSRDYNRLVSITSLNPGSGDPRSFNRMQETGPYEYDPELFWNRSSELGLDQRGLLFLRHGPPDEIRRPESTDYGGPPPSVEVWRYGSVFFPFQNILGAGLDYLFTPAYVRGIGNINKAMETESFRDPLPALELNGYWTYFKGEKEKLDVEFYHSVPVEVSPKAPQPKASLAFFDSTWNELVRDNSLSAEIKIPAGKQWIAVNAVSTAAGKYLFALRMDIQGHRAVKRDFAVIEPFAGNRIELSGVILGSPVNKGPRVHTRLGVDILPRPSLEFKEDEIITVYFEVYGLEEDQQGSRSYLERVTVTLIEEDKSRMASLLDGINPWSKERSARLTLTFNRQPETRAAAVAEYFTIDTSELVPGKYSLFIEVLDNNSRLTALTGGFFDITQQD